MGVCSTTQRNIKQKTSEVRHFSQQNIRQFYRLGEMIGKGNFATVHIGQSRDTQKCFAVKCIDKHQASMDLIQRELQILSRLDHPQIVRVHEQYEDENNFFFVMEYCRGGDLHRKILKDGPLQERVAQSVMRQLFSAIKYLHEHGIIHRDLKPENLMLVGGELDIRVIDFGLSKREKLNKKPSQLRTKCKHRTKVGTPIYVAPEVLKGIYSETCDEWALGCIMYVMLCGAPPFIGQTLQELEQQIQKPKLKQIAHISPECQDLINKLLEPNPNKRITCSQALKHPWMMVVANQTRLLTTMQSEENPLDNEKVVELLNAYQQCTPFKREALKILLTQLSDSQWQYLKRKFEELDKECLGVIQDGDLPIKQCITYTEFMAAMVNQPYYLSKERLENLFYWFDIKNRHYISRSDYVQAMSRKGLTIKDEQLNEIFNQMQLIKYDQFLEMMNIKKKPLQRNGLQAIKVQTCAGDQFI